MEKFLSFLGDYFNTVLFNWYGIILVITGAVGLCERIFERKIPIPVWLRTTVVIFVLLLAQMFAYRDLKNKYEGLQGKLTAQSDKTQTQQQESLKISHYSLGPTVRREKPGVTAYDFIVHTNQVITSVRLTASCDGDVTDAYANMLGISGFMQGGLERIDAKQYEIGISAPAWGPTTPLLVTLYSNQKLNCSFSQR